MNDVTLIAALEREETDFHLFLALAPEGTDIEGAVRDAFTEWHATIEGHAFVRQNGCNWGDALSIPAAHLRRHGIERLEPAFRPNGRVNPILVNRGCQRRLVVDHNTPLIGEKSPKGPP